MFAIPIWIRLVFFVLGNLPSIFRLIGEIRGLLSDLQKNDAKAVIKESKDDLRRFKKDGDKKRLFEALAARKQRYLKARKRAAENQKRT